MGVGGIHYSVEKHLWSRDRQARKHSRWPKPLGWGNDVIGRSSTEEKVIETRLHVFSCVETLTQTILNPSPDLGNFFSTFFNKWVTSHEMCKAVNRGTLYWSPFSVPYCNASKFFSCCGCCMGNNRKTGQQMAHKERKAKDNPSETPNNLWIKRTWKGALNAGLSGIASRMKMSSSNR